MTTLLLRLAGPMQSWGVQSRFGVRDSGLEPSKSGVVGLLAAALGRPRHQPVNDLAGLEMGVRVDREGRLARDYQTAREVLRADRSGLQETVVSPRFYLADADFLVGLAGPADLLDRLHRAVAAPAWQLYLGRKSFAPCPPVFLPDGLRGDTSLRDALASYPWVPRPRERPPATLRLIVAALPGLGEPRPDVPLDFARRRFAVRYVATEFVAPPSGPEAACS
jgi:CRISPR system Cascade subunit CasD